jgi:hypothetical protein
VTELNGELELRWPANFAPQSVTPPPPVPVRGGRGSGEGGLNLLVHEALSY